MDHNFNKQLQAFKTASEHFKLQLGDRYINLFTRQQQQQQTDVSKLLADRSLAEVIRGCARNETFYQIFDMDSLYHLNELEV